MVRISNMLVLVIFVLLLAACGKASRNPVGPDPNPSTGTLTVTVMSAGRPVDGANVTLSDGVGKQAKTDARGEVKFADLPFMNYTVTARGFGMEDASQLVTLDKAQVQTTLDVAGKTDVAVVIAADGKPRIDPVCGSTLGRTARISVTVQYKLVGAFAGPLSVRTELSLDGVNAIPDSGSGVGIDNATGVETNHPALRSNGSESRFFINTVVRWNTDRTSIIEALAKESFPCALKFQ